MEDGKLNRSKIHKYPKYNDHIWQVVGKRMNGFQVTYNNFSKCELYFTQYILSTKKKLLKPTLDL